MCSFGIEVVGRRTDPAARGEIRPVRPQIRPVAVGGQCQVMIESDGQSLNPCVLLSVGQLNFDLPLYVLIKENQPPMLSPEGLRLRR